MERVGEVVDHVDASSTPVVSDRRKISIQAHGEVVCFPDLFSFSIGISSTKISVEDAQLSVKRRSDYVLQVLRNHGLSRGKHVEVFSDVERGEEGSSIHCNITVSCGDHHNCFSVRNLLIQKLDTCVRFSPIHCSASLQHKAEKRGEAFRQAVANARAKAQSVSHTLGVQLGPALSLVEKQLVESLVSDAYTARNEEDACSLADRITKTSTVFSSEVTVVFEATPVKKCSHKRCTRPTNN